MDDIIERLMKAVHDGEIIPGHIDVDLLKEFSKMFRDSLFEGYGKGMADVDYDTPDYYSLQYLKNNLHAFGAAKTMDEIKAMSALLLDDAGNRRNWQSFKEQAMKLHEEYNVRWLRTEYDTAFANAQMARQWNDYQANDYYTSITIVTANDERVRDTHARWEGFTRPKNDPIWAQVWPPFDWNCRCDTSESFDGERGNIDVKDIPTLFRNNSGQSGVAFTGDHPYFKSMGQLDTPQASIYALKLTELTATGNYRLEKAGVLREKSREVMPSNRISTLKDKMQVKDADGSVVVLEGKQITLLSTDTIANADEQWIGRAGSRTYIKYYTDGIVAVRCDKKGVCTSVKVLNAEKAEEFRKGVLII